MSSQPPSDIESRVILLPATQKDADITRDLLARAGIECIICSSPARAAAEMRAGVGAFLLTDDAFGKAGIDELLTQFQVQAAWSEIPTVVLMKGASGAQGAGRMLESLGNVTLLERPAPLRSVVSAVQAALRSRCRQYEIRDQMETIRQAEAKARQLQEEMEVLLRSEQAARLDAERTSRMKDEFLATLSHELRTPLSAIQGWSYLLIQKKSELKAEMLEEGLTVIDRNARVQTKLIEDLLDMSRIISGKIRLDVQPVFPVSFIDAAVDTVKTSADAKGIRIQKVLDRQAGPILGDSNRLQQVMWNLLSNSIKFTPRGGVIQIILQKVSSHLELSVSDTGQGLSAEFLPHVFERFRQADASSTRRQGGLGLGLSIVRHLVELHGGSVRAYSAGEGQGSTFLVELPVAIAYHQTPPDDRLQPTEAEPAAATDPCITLEGLKVLVVDDDDDSRDMIRRVLIDCKAEVVAASSAAEALPLVESYRPDVVVSDIGMPDVDGYEFIRRVRALGADRGGNVPALALTAFARSRDRTKALLAGFQVHAAKPVDPPELIATVASLGGMTKGDK